MTDKTNASVTTGISPLAIDFCEYKGYDKDRIMEWKGK